MRLDAIISYIAATNPGPIIHSESDVIFMPNFPWDKVHGLKDIAWTRYNSHSDSAAIMYFPDKRKTIEFGILLNNFLRTRNMATDMLILSEISHAHPNNFKILPSIDDVSSNIVNSHNVSSVEEIKQMHENFPLFEGLFDGAAFGMWLTGQDPRNHRGYTKILSDSNISNGDSLIDPSNVRYRFTDKNLFIDTNELQIPIWNLHIHSKNLKLFDTNWETELSNFVKRSNLGKPYDKFEYKILFKVLKDHKQQNNLFRFFINLPYLAVIKNYFKKRF
jgi:hypothetical protein